MPDLVSRRTLLGGLLGSAALAPTLGLIFTGTAAGAAATLDPNDPAAKDFAYAADSSKVNAAGNPSHKPGQECRNCGLFGGAAGDAAGSCDVFPGKTVAAIGWCSAWTKKRGA